MFWTYKQIPVDGQLVLDDTFSTYIIIEDNSAAQSNNRIDNFGIYYDEGSTVSKDSRWPRAEGPGTEEPMINGVLAHEFVCTETPVGKNYCTVLYRDNFKSIFPKI